MFEVPNQGIGTFSSRVTLEPPHYDGVQSLALRDNVLFSGSRDYVIKKWDLESKELLTVSIYLRLFMHNSYNYIVRRIALHTT